MIKKRQNSHSLFIGGLPVFALEGSIMEYFSNFGKIQDVHLIIDWVTNKSKCCAIIVCHDKITMELILKKKKHKINGKRIRVSIADKKKKGTKIIKTKKIYIGNLKQTTKTRELRVHFEKYGEIANLVIVTNPLKIEKQGRYGIIEFERKNDAKLVLDKRDEHFVEGAKLTCSPLKASKESHLARIYQRLSHIDQDHLGKCIKDYFGRSILNEAGIQKIGEGMKFSKQSIENFIRKMNEETVKVQNTSLSKEIKSPTVKIRLNQNQKHSSLYNNLFTPPDNIDDCNLSLTTDDNRSNNFDLFNSKKQNNDILQSYQQINTFENTQPFLNMNEPTTILEDGGNSSWNLQNSYKPRRKKNDFNFQEGTNNRWFNLFGLVDTWFEEKQTTEIKMNAQPTKEEGTRSLDKFDEEVENRLLKDCFNWTNNVDRKQGLRDISQKENNSHH